MAASQHLDLSALSKILYIILIAHGETLTCDHGHSLKYLSHDPYGNQMCQKCSKCPPGSGVSVECQGSHDTVCERCPEGTYSGTWSATRICLPCTMCSPHQRTIRECTSTRNAKCVKNCDVGFYLNTLSDDCEMCSWCFPDRPELFTPRLDDCMRSEIPEDYQCMRNVYEHRPFVMSSRNESTLPVTNQENSGDGELTGAVDDRKKYFLKQKFPLRSTIFMTSTEVEQSDRDPIESNNGSHIGTPTQINAIMMQTGNLESGVHITSAQTTITVVVVVVIAISTVVVAILVISYSRHTKQSNEKETLLGYNLAERGDVRSSHECGMDAHPESLDHDDQRKSNNEDKCVSAEKNEKHYVLGKHDDIQRLQGSGHSYGGLDDTIIVDCELNAILDENQRVRAADLIERKSPIERVVQINQLSGGSRRDSRSRDGRYEQDIDDQMCSLDEHIMLSEELVFSDSGTRV
ncbi:uncharacterized protein LOC100378743 [Saccoglossus kowalevskii]|uniref:Tumor necrosis factor receptor superfamily member 16-like n=1 Tax=Saccoglossus kowalevskii TaxID=10224 RepID=A0ABM0GYZ4_SACKO|nr:PREDICTED: tumor necrosis factor receptor superfamily member 16-like [Saccoglossus kowalevskii]